MNKTIKRQLLYEEAVETINKYSNNYIVLSFRYYKNTKFFAKLIQKLAHFRGNPKIAHTAAIYKYGADPRLFEAITSGINHASLYDRVFSGKFYGRVEAHVLKAKQTARKRLELSNYIEHELLGAKYSVGEAIGSYIDIIYDQIGEANQYYCTKLISMIYKRIAEEDNHFICNDSEITPGEYFSILDKESIDKFLIFDSDLM
jgi:hypothetical protein